MAEKQRCPRRGESPNPDAYGDGTSTPDRWDRRYGRKGPRSCSYCGSMHPDDFLAAARDGSGELGPTDKNYKVYVTIESVTYTPTSSTWQNGKQSNVVKHPKAPAMLKFYFQHLSHEQMHEFVDLYNARPKRLYSDQLSAETGFKTSFTQEDAPGCSSATPGTSIGGRSS